MKLERVLQMTANEVVVRGRQEASKWLDRMAAGDRRSVTPALLDRVWERVPSRFFEGAACADETARRIEPILESHQRPISIADAICRGRFDLLGYRGLGFGDPVDWHLDPISGRRAPVDHWSRLDPLDPATVGDGKVVWELNRHQWLLHLGQAYRFTGDERYAEAFARHVQGWIRANPAGMGINWASSLEVALRLISWCWAVMLFKDSRMLSAGFLRELLAGIENHARHIERYLSFYFAPNTHLTGEALGLFYAGVLFPDLSRARRWRACGMRILIEQCARQILDDGVYFEQTTCYQRYTAEIYLHFLILAARNGIGVPDGVAARLQRLLDFLMAVRRPDGSMPQIGDADGGWLLPLIPRTPDDLRGVFSVAAAFFGRSDYAWAARGPAPEALWLLGAPGMKSLETLPAARPAGAPSALFADGGYAVMRSDWGEQAHHLIFDVGPLGDPVCDGHAHSDLLSIQCSVFGAPYLADPGVSHYAVDRRWRDFFRGTTAHSTVMVDGAEQAVAVGPFAWKAPARARLRRWSSTATLDVADADHDAFRRLPDPVIHRRRVAFVKPRYWVVVDDLDGRAQHLVELRFQFAPIDVTLDPDPWARARGPGGRGLLIRPFAAVALKAEIREGEVAPIQGWVSPDYGLRRPAPVVIYSTTAALPLRIVTLLYPMEDCLASPPAVAPLVCEGPGPAGLIFGRAQERICFDDQEFIVSSGRDVCEADDSEGRLP